MLQDALRQGKSLSLQPAWDRLLRGGLTQPVLDSGKGGALQGLAIGDSRWMRIVERGGDGLAHAQAWQPLQARTLMLRWQELDDGAYVLIHGIGKLPLPGTGDISLRTGSSVR